MKPSTPTITASITAVPISVDLSVARTAISRRATICHTGWFLVFTVLMR
ncbi:hypothetical protein ACFVDI_25885 [Nocardioides sp. NPDC057767]